MAEKERIILPLAVDETVEDLVRCEWVEWKLALEEAAPALSPEYGWLAEGGKRNAASRSSAGVLTLEDALEEWEAFLVKGNGILEG